MPKTKFTFYLKEGKMIFLTDDSNTESLDELTLKFKDTLNSAKIYSFTTDTDSLVVRSQDVLAIQISNKHTDNKRKSHTNDISNLTDDIDITEVDDVEEETEDGEYYVDGDLSTVMLDVESEEEVDRMFYEQGMSGSDDINSDSTSS